MTAALGAVLEAFIREHEYCGELDTGLEDDRVDDVYVRGGDGPAPREGGEGGSVMETPRRSDRPRLLLWLNTAAKLRARLLTLERGVAREELERGVARDRRNISGGCRACWRGGSDDQRSVDQAPPGATQQQRRCARVSWQLSR